MSTNGVGGRLERTLRQNEMSLRRAEVQLKPTGVRGIGYGNLHAIIRHGAPMSIQLAEAIASTFAVNAAWLAFGAGESGLPERRSIDRRSQP